MEQFNVGDIVVYNDVVCEVYRPIGKDGKVRLDKSPYRVDPQELRKPTRRERSVYLLSKMSDAEYEDFFTILAYYDAELGKIEQGQDGVPYNIRIYEAYLEKKCDNLQTQCQVMYRLLKCLGG